MKHAYTNRIVAISNHFHFLSISLYLSQSLFISRFSCAWRAHKKSLKLSEASSRLLGWLTVLSCSVLACPVLSCAVLCCAVPPHHRGFGQLATQVIPAWAAGQRCATSMQISASMTGTFHMLDKAAIVINPLAYFPLSFRSYTK